MLDDLKQLYMDSGLWAQPILFSTLALIMAWTIMMFTVRMIKRFIVFSAIAFLLLNGIGLVGYIDNAGDVKKAIVERGEELSGELRRPIEDIEFSPLYLGLIGSAVTVALGVTGMARVHRRNRSKEKAREDTNQ